MNSDRVWQARWIGTYNIPAESTPVFRKTFLVDSVPDTAAMYISGMGFYVLHINGRRVSDHLLTPAFTAYDRTVLYDVHDVADYLHAGENLIEVTLGTGLYNDFRPNAWEYEHAAWHGNPQLICELWADNKLLVRTDLSWEYALGPITWNSLRSGETYDATYEIRDWKAPKITAGPGGKLIHKVFPPIRLRECLSAKRIGGTCVQQVWDCGVNLAGNVEIAVSGPRGAKVKMVYAELLDSAGYPVQHNIDCHVKSERFQTDEYICSGEGIETWHSEFCYHGFRYVSVHCPGNVIIHRMTGRCFHTDLQDAGGILTDYAPVQALHDAVRRSTLTNFHHMPTDCPHREKNGWTGDASLSCEQAMFNFDMTDAYRKWLDDIVDSQRPNGAIACIVPTSIWGYNWANGATWDSVLFELPWQVYRYTGDKEFLARYHEAQCKYVSHLEGMGLDGIYRYGLGDWYPPPEAKHVPNEAVVTAYAYYIYTLHAKISAVLGHQDASAAAQALANETKQAFQQVFVPSVERSQPFNSLMLYMDLAPDRDEALAELIQEIEAADYHMMGGIITAKAIFNVLTSAGRFDVAWKMLNVKGYPGYLDMLNRCSGTLGETWDGRASQNHHMFSEIGAWFYKALAGIQLDEIQPGFRHITLTPHIPADMAHFSAWHDTPMGKLTVAWDENVVHIELPIGCTAALHTREHVQEITGTVTVDRSLFT